MLYNNDFYFFAYFNDTLFIQTNFTNSRASKMDITISFEDMVFNPNSLELLPFLRTGVGTGWKLNNTISMFKSIFTKPPAELFREDPDKLIDSSSTLYKVFLDTLIEIAKKRGIALNIPLKKKRELYVHSLEWFRLNLEGSVDDIKNSAYSQHAAPYLVYKDNDIWFCAKCIDKFNKNATDIYSSSADSTLISSVYTQLIGKSIFSLSDYGLEALSSRRAAGTLDVLKAAMHLSKTPEEFHERIKKVGLGRNMIVVKKAELISELFGTVVLDLKLELRSSELLALYTKTLWRNDSMLIETSNKGVS